MRLIHVLGAVVTVSSLFFHSAAYSYESGDIVFRAGVTNVAPQNESDQLKLNGTPISSTLSVNNNSQLGLNLVYLLSKNWGVELLAATPFSHTATGTDALAGLDIVDLEHLPPTLSAIYFFDVGTVFKPYIGAGINYTLFSNEKLTTAGETALGSTGKVTLSDSTGLALQMGADFAVNEQWHINTSVRWMDINTSADISLNNGSKVTTDIELDPYVYTLSVGYKF